MHELKRSVRRQKLYDFAHSVKMGDSIAVVTISSIPRWHLARALFPDKVKSDLADEKENAHHGKGLWKALNSCILDTHFILRGNCPLSEWILRGVEDPGLVRVAALRALLRTVVYIVDCFRGRS